MVQSTMHTHYQAGLGVWSCTHPAIIQMAKRCWVAAINDAVWPAHHKLQHLHEAFAQPLAVYAGVQLQLIAIDDGVVACQLQPLHLLLHQLILLYLKPDAPTKAWTAASVEIEAMQLSINPVSNANTATTIRYKSAQQRNSLVLTHQQMPSCADLKCV